MLDPRLSDEPDRTAVADAPGADAHAGPAVTRRGFLQTAAAAAGTGAVSGALAATQAATPAAPPPTAAGDSAARAVTLDVNGQRITMQLEPRVTLLDALRDYAQLTGTKKGCDRGQCGACTVIVDGRRVNACLTLAVMAEGSRITTVEGLAPNDDHLSPLQAAFVEYDAFQCGFCTPGQLCSATAVLDELKQQRVSFVTQDVRAPRVPVTEAELRERMSGNLCRCGAYPNIVRAMRSVVADMSGALSKPAPATADSSARPVGARA